MISVAIVEDNPSDARLLKECIELYGKNNEIDFSISEFSNAIDFLDNYKPIYSVIFMDIQMPYYNGLKASKELRKVDETVLLVFVTTLAQYAIKGYEVAALDYVIKPVSYEAMAPKIRRIVRAVNKADSDYTVLSFGTESVRVKVSDMRYLEAAEHVITVHFKDGEPFKTRKSLSALETELSPAPHYFIRVNNYTLVNPKYVTRTDGQEIWLGDDVLTVSRARRKLVMEKLTEYMGKR